MVVQLTEGPAEILSVWTGLYPGVEKQVAAMVRRFRDGGQPVETWMVKQEMLTRLDKKVPQASPRCLC